MNTEALYTLSSGIRIVSGDADIIIDEACFQENTPPQAFIFSCLKSLINGYEHLEVPGFTSTNIKQLFASAFDEDPGNIISCLPGKKSTIRKNGNPICELTFYSNPDFPANSSVLIKTDTNRILYVTDSTLLKMPSHDTLVISANKKTPLKSIISRVKNVVVKIEDFSGLTDVLRFFNEEFNDTSVGVDSSVTEKAYEYLKADCTVFSSSVKPLNSFKKSPSIIITEDETLYTDRFCIYSSDFNTEMSLSEIYDLAGRSHAKSKIAICPGLASIRKRGSLTLCPPGSIIHL